MNTIVVYYSRRGQNYVSGSIKNLKKGNAEMIVEIISKNKDVDMFHIETVKDYPTDYTECTVVAKEEKRNNDRPEIASKIQNFEQYENIILVYPNWWGTCPMCVFTFLESHHTSRKHIYPICTHEGSGLGNSVEDIKVVCTDAIIHDGLEVCGSKVRSLENKITSYIQNIGE